MKSKINFSILLVILLGALLASVVLLPAQNTGAQVDMEACQNEYNKRRNQCRADDNDCSAPCRELPQGNVDALARCYAPCNEKRNACDEAAIDEQRKCLGVWPYNQDANADLPVVDAQPNPADVPAAQPPKTTIPPPIEPPGRLSPSTQITPPLVSTSAQTAGLDQAVADFLAQVEEWKEQQPEEEKYKEIEAVIKAELGLSPEDPLPLPPPTPAPKRSDFEPDEGYEGLEFEVPFGPSPPEQESKKPKILNGREDGDSKAKQEQGRISNFRGRVIIERQQPDGSVKRVQVRRFGTSIRPNIVYPEDKLLIGEDTTVEFSETNGAETRFEAPPTTEQSTGDEIDIELRKTALEEPDGQPPVDMDDIIDDTINTMRQRTPYGIVGRKG